mmetsp:Transcript_2311/g.5349  ORF Transcript_2311/g.5349 Transcript_2311/m.5349 type:complete len:203 (+) Transcript_2311:2-610(+)
MYIAEYYTECHIVAVTDSWIQADHIERECESLGVTNVEVITADIASFKWPSNRFDRVYGIGLARGLENTPALFKQVAKSLKSRGKFFVEHYAHRTIHARADRSLKVAGYFGVCTAEDLLLLDQSHFLVEDRWVLDGRHAAQTFERWLHNLDRNADSLQAMLSELRSSIQLMRIRIYLQILAELFGYANGCEWSPVQILFCRR